MPTASSTRSASAATRASRAEDAALARRILLRPAGVVAFVPAPLGAGVDVWHLLPRLAAALAVLSPGRMALVQAPALAEILDRPGDDDPAPQVRAVAPELDVLVLPESDSVVRSVAPLGRAFESARLRYAHILLDAAGFLPDAPEVLDLADAIVSVATAGVTKERELVEVVQMLPSDRHVGTLLVE
jgi:hypothetical protein